VKKVDEYTEKASQIPIKPKTAIEEEWNTVTDKKKPNEQDIEPEKKVVAPPQKLTVVAPQKEPESIQMKILVLDKEVNFDYNLIKDTPEVVAKEFVSEMKFDTKEQQSNYYATFKDRIV
jgi:hypothetical protein